MKTLRPLPRERAYRQSIHSRLAAMRLAPDLWDDDADITAQPIDTREQDR